MIWLLDSNPHIKPYSSYSPLSYSLLLFLHLLFPPFSCFSFLFSSSSSKSSYFFISSPSTSFPIHLLLFVLPSCMTPGRAEDLWVLFLLLLSALVSSFKIRKKGLSVRVRKWEVERWRRCVEGRGVWRLHTLLRPLPLCVLIFYFLLPARCCLSTPHPNHHFHPALSTSTLTNTFLWPRLSAPACPPPEPTPLTVATSSSPSTVS